MRLNIRMQSKCNQYWNIRSWNIGRCRCRADWEQYLSVTATTPDVPLSYLWQLALILHISQIYTNTLPPKCWRTRLNFASESLGGVLLQPLWSTLLGAVRSHHRSVKYKHNQKLLSMWLSVGMNVLLQKGLTCQSYTTIITRQSVHLVKLPNPQHKRNATRFHLPDPSNPGVVCVL